MPLTFLAPAEPYHLWGSIPLNRVLLGIDRDAWGERAAGDDGDGNFHPAVARIIPPNGVEIRSDAAPAPTAVRYAHDNDPDVNLANTPGLPAIPFVQLPPNYR